MSETRMGLTWSGKWHIVDETRSDPRYDVSLCGAYLYNEEKEKTHYLGAKLPQHLQKIIDGTAKSTGECKRCNKSTGRKTVVVELPERAPDDLHEARWEVPLYNPYNDVVGEPKSMYTGEVWIGVGQNRSGKIAVTSTPSILETAEDARRLAAALLAAADWKDKNPTATE